MIVAASAFTVGNTMIVAGMILAVVLLLRAVRRGQTRPEARLGGGISGFDRRMPHLPELPDPPSPPPGARSRRPRLRRREEETTTLLRPESATTSRWSTREPPAEQPSEPSAPWHEPPGGDTWDDSTGRR